MEMKRTLVSLFFLSAVCARKNVVDQLTRKGYQLIAEATTSRHIRECSCDEEVECTDDIKLQVYDCFDVCWENLREITDRPNDLKACLQNRTYILDNILDCMHRSGKGCVPDMNGPDINYIDINRLISRADEQINTQVGKFARTLPTSTRQLIDVGLRTGKCIEDCFVGKNSGGYCFDRRGCQPKIDVKTTGPLLMECSKHLHWQEEALGMCDCVLEAGVERVRPYCDIMRQIGKRRHV